MYAHTLYKYTGYPTKTEPIFLDVSFIEFLSLEIFKSLKTWIFLLSDETIWQDYGWPSKDNLQTLFNIMEAPLIIFLNFDVCVASWCSDGPINSQEHKSFEMYAVTIKISVTE